MPGHSRTRLPGDLGTFWEPGKSAKTPLETALQEETKKKLLYPVSWGKILKIGTGMSTFCSTIDAAEHCLEREP